MKYILLTLFISLGLMVSFYICGIKLDNTSTNRQLYTKTGYIQVFDKEYHFIGWKLISLSRSGKE